MLTEIAEWLTDTYRRDVKLSGIIYLHRITDLRMTGSAKENYLRFQRLCGPEALRKVILATSMWEGVDPAVGEARERELAETEEFWGYMLRHRSQMHRHYNTAESVRRLIGVFAGSATPEPISLRLQEEIVDQGMSLIETQVGRGWEQALDKEREKYRKELEDIRAAMKEQMSKELKELEEHMQKKLDKSEKDRDALASAMEDKNRSHTKELETVKKELGSVSQHLHTEKSFTRRVVKSLEDHAKGLDLRTRSRPTGENFVDQDIHLSIHGAAFAFCGPKYTVMYGLVSCSSVLVPAFALTRLTVMRPGRGSRSLMERMSKTNRITGRPARTRMICHMLFASLAGAARLCSIMQRPLQ